MFGIRLKPNASFTGFNEYLKSQDVLGMARWADGQIPQLVKRKTPMAQGAFIYYWLTFENTNEMWDY